MGWAGKIFGGAIGFAIAGPVGAAVGIGLGSLADQEDTSSADEIRVEGRYGDEEIGRYLRLEVQQLFPANCQAVLNILDHNNTYVKGASFYTDEDGDFCLVTPVDEQTLRCFIPFGAVQHTGPGNYKFRFTFCHVPEGAERPTVLGHATLEMDLPSPRPFDMVALIEPLVALGMSVARADGVVEPEEVSYLRTFLTEAFELGTEDMPTLRNAMKRISHEPVETLLAQILQRIPNANMPTLLDFLAQVAYSDGRLDLREVELIKHVAQAVFDDPRDVEQVLDMLQLNIVDAYAVLDVAPGASMGEIKAVYHRRVNEYHPDRVSSLPQEFQQLAHEKFLEIRQAYEVLGGT